MKSLCNRQVSVWNPDTSKEIVCFVHEVHPVFAVTLSTFLDMLCGSNDDTMPTFNLFRVHLKCFSISGSYSSKQSVNAWKKQMKSQRVENWWCGFEWCILNAEKVWSSNKFKKMKSLCNRQVSVWNPDTSKEIVRFVHEVHPVFAVTLSTFFHMLCGWNDDTMPTFNLFRVHLKCFSILGSYSSK